MNLTINNKQVATFLVAEGAIDEKDLIVIMGELDKLPANQEKYILLDCAGLKKVIYGSIGFSGLVTRFLELKSKNTKIVLFGHDGLTYRLLKMLKMDDMFQFSQTLDEAYLILSKTCKEATHPPLPGA